MQVNGSIKHQVALITAFQEKKKKSFLPTPSPPDTHLLLSEAGCRRRACISHRAVLVAVLAQQISELGLIICFPEHQQAQGWANEGDFVLGKTRSGSDKVHQLGESFLHGVCPSPQREGEGFALTPRLLVQHSWKQLGLRKPG